MAQLEKIIKVTQEQYDTLQEGGTVGSYIGIDPNFIYLVEGSSDDGTTVIPNPTLSGSETVLTSLGIDGTNYRMPEVTVDETYVSDALSNFIADEIEPRLENKQDTLVSGTNIKTINGISILGSGNIGIEGGSGSGTSVEANPVDEASYILNKLKVAGVTYSIPSGATVIEKTLDMETTSITFTEAELAQLKSDAGIVVYATATDGETTMTLPLSQIGARISAADMSQQVVLFCGAIEYDMYFVFTPTTENPLIYVMGITDNPFGESIDTSKFATKSEVNSLNTSVNSLNTSVNSLKTSKQDKLTAGENITIENNIITSEALIKEVLQLPTPTAEEYAKHKLYLYDAKLNYITKIITDGSTVDSYLTETQTGGKIAAAVVGTDIYLFGGNTDSGYQNTIQKLSTTTNTITTLSTTIPEGVEFSSPTAVIGKYVYLLAKDCELYKYDLETKIFRSVVKLESLITGSTQGTTSCRGMVSVGTNIYFLGGYNGLLSPGRYDTILKFSTITNKAVKLDATLPKKLYGSAVAVGTDIYLYGTNLNDTSIYKFNTITEEVETLSVKLPHASEGAEAVAVGTNIYFFGGYVGRDYRTQTNLIDKFNTITEEAETLSATLPVVACPSATLLVGNDIYILGGMTDNGSSYLDNIYKYSLTVSYEYKTIATEE